VLAYSHENAVEPFLEPVVGLCQALLDKDQQDMHRNMDGETYHVERLLLLPVIVLSCGHHMLSLAAQTHRAC